MRRGIDTHKTNGNAALLFSCRRRLPDEKGIDTLNPLKHRPFVALSEKAPR